VAFIAGLILLSIYVGFTVEDLFIDEAVTYPTDYALVQLALEIGPFGEHDETIFIDEMSRPVKVFLLSISQDIFQNIKFLPFVASILLVIVTYFFTVQISKKRFSGIVSMAVLLQSYTFLEYDTIAIYANFWTLFYVFSLYVVSKRWYLSPLSYILSVLGKVFAGFFLPMTIFFIYRANIDNKTKIITIASYLVVTIIAVTVFAFTETKYFDSFRISFTEFLLSFSVWAFQMHLDPFIVLTILPVTVGLFIATRRGIKEADSILVLILGTLLAGPILLLISDYTYMMPYRLIPFLVFFSISVGVFLSRKTN